MTDSILAIDGLIGTILDDRFSVVSLISKGGLSVLYKGVDKTSTKQVTIRVLLTDRTDEEQSIARFKAAVKVMEGIRHANIVPILGSGATPAGAPYLVLPFIEGRSVKDKVDKDGVLSIEQALPIIKDIGSALEFAHQHGIIHRNLKPSNVLLTEVDGVQRAVLTGFGIAKKAKPDGDTVSSTTKVVGSPLYMSPEQFINSKIDARSDIYSFACVIHQMLSGAPPFDASNLVQLMGAHHHQYRPHFPAELHVASFVDDILDAATMKLPGNRYQTVAQMVSDFEARKCTVDLAAARSREPAANEANAQRQHTIKSTAMITAGTVLLVALIIFIVAFDSLSKSRSKMPPVAVNPKKSQIAYFIDSGQYVEAIAIVTSQLTLAESAGERTETLHEKIGALAYLSSDFAQARKQFEQAVEARKGIAQSEPDTKQLQERKINEDMAMVALTYLPDEPDEARKVAETHLKGARLSSLPEITLIQNLLDSYNQSAQPDVVHAIGIEFPSAVFLPPTGTNVGALNEYLINLCERE